MLTLLQPDTERITPVEHKPTHDRAPEGLALGTSLAGCGKTLVTV
jgi:D-lactate dehydrogenase